MTKEGPTTSDQEKRPDIEVIIKRMATKQIANNGNCTITVNRLARAAAEEAGLLEGKYSRPSKEIYTAAERVLQELGGTLWDSDGKPASKRHVYLFNSPKKSLLDESSDIEESASTEMFKAPAENESSAVRATKLAMMLAIELKECYTSDDPSGYFLGKTLIESLASIYDLEVTQ